MELRLPLLVKLFRLLRMVLNEKNLRKLRLTVDKLEERLRQIGISSISDVEFATLETSG